jgi:hypothetical protein
MAKAPKSVTIRTYHVGFGDCFLLSFEYGPKSERHVLIDYGSTGLPDGVPKTRMMDIANDIRKRTGNKLHAVVATHRHRDHISGFATQKGGTGTGDVIRSLKPEIVVQPWTEDPDLDPSAIGPGAAEKKVAARSKTRGKSKKTLAAVHDAKIKKFGAGTAQHVNALALMNAFALQALSARNLPKALAGEIRFLGEANLANTSAVKNLMTMAKNRYVFTGAKSGLESVLPGVKIDVLGPPTVKQTDTITKQRARDPDEFWHFALASLRAAAPAADQEAPLFPRHVAARGDRFPISARWLVYHARKMRADQLLQIVRDLDKQMNNTSVILLMRIGGTKLLFPGDAQIENWQFALGQKKYTDLLKSVNLYKVGHHGSLNATPKSLWKLFANKSAKKSAKRLLSLMSTMEGKHGSTDSHTEVPRATLVEALEQESDFFSTQQLKGKDFFHDTKLSF